MAKVDGPLMSLEARGKIADAIVFFPWKGRHVVRQWLKPANPTTTTQGYVRAALKAISKWVKKILSISGGDALDSIIYAAFTDTAPAGLNWNAFAGQGFLDQLQDGGVFKTTDFLALVANYSTDLDTDALAAFEAAATGLGMEDFAFGYGYTVNIPAGLQMYFGALACYHDGIIGSAPYDTDPVSWADSDVTNFLADMTTDV